MHYAFVIPKLKLIICNYNILNIRLIKDQDKQVKKQY